MRKDHWSRHLHDAHVHTLEAERSFQRAADRLPEGTLATILEGLARGQKNVRKLVKCITKGEG